MERSPWLIDDEMLQNLFKIAGATSYRGTQTTFFCPRILMGTDALILFKGAAPAVAPRKKALIVTDKIVRHLGEKVAGVLQEVGFEVKIWDEVMPEPPVENVLAGAALAREFEPGFLVAVGGGSVIDAAKCVWIGYERPDLDLRMVNPLEPLGLRKKAYFVAVPTTSGTGSEATAAAVISDGQKMSVLHPELVPCFAIMDPTFHAGMPPELTAYTGMDVLAHAAGSIVSHWSNEYSEIMGLKALELCLKYLPRAVADGGDLEARSKMMIASNMAGLAFGNAMPGMEHAAGHAFGKIFNLHHGAAVGLFTPYMLQYVSRVTEKYLRITGHLHISGANNGEKLENLVLRLEDFARSINCPVTIADTGVTRDDFEEKLELLAETAMADSVSLVSIRPMTLGNYRKFFRCAYDGSRVDF